MAKECIHKFQVDGKNVGTCSKCGEVVQYPYDKSEPVVLKKGSLPGKKFTRKSSTRINNFQRHRYYEDNKAAIIADFFKLDREAVQKKWGIPSPTLSYLAKRWLTEEQRGQIFRGPAQLVVTPGNGRLSQLPEFSNTWEASVQVVWLQAYIKLLDRQEV